MRNQPEECRKLKTERTFLILGIILVSSDMRAPLTSVGSLVGWIQADMGLSSAWGGLLTTLPLLVFAVFSLITPRIAHRLGIESVLFLSLITPTVGILWRSGVTAAALFTGTVVVGMGIAMMNVLLPGLIKGDFPDRLVGLGAGRNAVLAEKETVSINS